MVEAIEKKKKKNKEGREEKKRSKWSAGLLSLVLLVLSVAIVISWSTAGPKIGSFSRTGGDKPCSCSKDERDYGGIVEDCCCDYETVDHLNDVVLHPLLQDLVKTPFFRYFKVKLWCDCLSGPAMECAACEIVVFANAQMVNFLRPSNDPLSFQPMILCVRKENLKLL